MATSKKSKSSSKSKKSVQPKARLTKSAKAEKKQSRRRPIPDLETLRNAELVPVDFFPLLEPAFTAGSLRWLLFNRDQNGLSKSGAVAKSGRRIFIVPKRFRAWAHAAGSK